MRKKTSDTAPILVFVTTVPLTLDLFFRGQFNYCKQLGFRIVGISSAGPQLPIIRQREQIETVVVSMDRNVSPIRDLLALARLYLALKKLKPMIIHASTPKAGLLAMISATVAHVPIRIFTVRGLMSEMSGNSSYILKSLERFTCELAHAVMSNSSSVARELVQNKLCKPKKITVCGNGSSNGVEAEHLFNPNTTSISSSLELRRKLGIPEARLVIGFVGRIVRDKGILELARAWAGLRRKYGSCHLLIKGEIEEEEHEINLWLAGLRQDPQVTFSGWSPKDQMPLYYSITDILVLPTYREGFPNVILEGSAMELPIVATRVTGCVDAVVDGVTGTLVPAKDPVALAGAIEKYIVDPELRRQHGQAGRLRVLHDFRPEMIWNDLHDLYIKLLKEKGLPIPKPLD